MHGLVKKMNAWQFFQKKNGEREIIIKKLLIFKDDKLKRENT